MGTIHDLVKDRTVYSVNAGDSVMQAVHLMVDKVALVFGLVLGPVLTAMHLDLDLMWTGVVGGTLAYAVHRLRQAAI